MQHIVIEYTGAFSGFAGIGDQRHFFIDGRWSQRTLRRKLIEDAEQANLRAKQRGWEPVYASGYTVLGENDLNTLHPMPYVTAHNFTWDKELYGRTILFSRSRNTAIQVFSGGVLLGHYTIGDELRDRPNHYRVMVYDQVGDDWATLTIRGLTNVAYEVVRHLVGA